jgi:hypothetical protein
MSRHVWTLENYLLKQKLALNLSARKNFSFIFYQLCFQQESNLHLGLRSPLFYPLNYGGKAISKVLLNDSKYSKIML